MTKSPASKTLVVWLAVAVAIVAVVTGLPSLRGGFLAGDDLHLILNHILVNHPTWGHALELLTLRAHRDLYQPVPLLTYSLDFVVVNALGLLPTTEGPHAGAWIFHLTNVLVHAVNAALVFFVIRRFSWRPCCSPSIRWAPSRSRG
jgi:hypothetical protein